MNAGGVKAIRFLVSRSPRRHYPGLFGVFTSPFDLGERQNSWTVVFKNPATDSARHHWLKQNSLIISLLFIPFFLYGRFRCGAFNPLYNPLTVYKLQCAARWNFLSAHLSGSTAGLWNLVPMDAESASYDSPQQMWVQRQGGEGEDIKYISLRNGDIQ